MPKNYLITGLPRSGTTLLTSQLSQNMEAVTFSEPEWLKEVRKKSKNCREFVTEFEKKLIRIRADIRKGKAIYIKTSRFNQGLPDNYYHRNDKGDIIVDKDESPVIFPKSYADKPFIIKANAQFTACLGELVKNKNYKIICVVRDPVATIMSWRSLNIPVSQGHLKIAEKYHLSFVNETRADNLLEKQVLILDWFFKEYTIFKDFITLIKYEELVCNTLQTISNITSNKLNKISSLESKNLNKHYNLNEKKLIKEKVSAVGTYLHYYYRNINFE